jgi:hypothetical protein
MMGWKTPIQTATNIHKHQQQQQQQQSKSKSRLLPQDNRA